VVSPAVAVVQCGLLGDPSAALIAADAALHDGLTTLDEIESAIGWHQGIPHIGATRAVLRLVDARAESPYESLTRLALIRSGWHGYTQVDIPAEGHHYIVDMVIEGVPLVVEVDGAAKYESKADLVAEKVREDDIRGLGFGFVRVMPAEVTRPSLTRRLTREIDAVMARRASWPPMPWNGDAQWPGRF